MLVFERAARPKGKAAVLARVFGKAGSSVYMSVCVPDRAALAAARADVERGWLSFRRRSNGPGRYPGWRAISAAVASRLRASCAHEQAEVAKGDVVETAQEQQVDDDPQQPDGHQHRSEARPDCHRDAGDDFHDPTMYMMVCAGSGTTDVATGAR